MVLFLIGKLKMYINLALLCIKHLQALRSNSSLALMEHRIRDVRIRRHKERVFGRLLSFMMFLTPLKLKVRVPDGVLGDLISVSSSSKGFPGGFGVSGVWVGVGGSHSVNSRTTSSWPLALDCTCKRKLGLKREKVLKGMQCTSHL